MQNRLNTLEAELVYFLSDEEDITDEFNTVERGFRGDVYNFYANQMPALSVESIEVENDLWASSGSHVFEKIKLYLEINACSAELSDARQKVKELISLVRSFLRSSSWPRAEATTLGRSEFGSYADTEVGFRCTGYVECIVEINVECDSILPD